MSAELSRRVAKIIEPMTLEGMLSLSDRIEFANRIEQAASFEELSEDDKELILTAESNLNSSTKDSVTTVESGTENPMMQELDRIKLEIESGSVTRRTLIALQYVLENLKADMENSVQSTAPKTEAELAVPEEIPSQDIEEVSQDNPIEEVPADEIKEEIEADTEMPIDGLNTDESDVDSDLAEAESILADLSETPDEEDLIEKKAKPKKKAKKAVKENAHGIQRNIPIEHDVKKEGESDLKSIEEDVIEELKKAGFFEEQDIEDKKDD